MPWVVGDSYGGVQAADTAQEGMQRAAFANSMANVLSGLRERNNTARQNRQMDFQEQAHEDDQKFKERELALRNQESIWRNQRDTEHNQISRGFLDEQKNQSDWLRKQPNPQTLKNQDYESNLASSQADRGLFGSPDDIPYQWMSPAQKALLLHQSLYARDSQKRAFDTANEAAGTLNRYNELQKSLKDVDNEPQTDVPWYNIGGVGRARDAKKKVIQQQMEPFARRKALIEQDPKMRGLISLDPESGKYVPAIPPPNWSRPSIPSSGAQDDVDPGHESDLAPDGQTGSTSLAPTATPGSGYKAPRTGSSSPRIPSESGLRPMVYDRTRYWVGRGMEPEDALQKALQEDKSLE